ncbi:hypothetical protein GCM10011529_18790 [Polymorphobacter glacialis]|uniref:DUF2784 domain-containing protein n=1 Tax=Sandarakinorhabdus glacialis TaxID=1614636 RepID=A0A916ZU23_9SPHN|nr:DUF2784 domain-containing protein [Polymorphobacter glacialis]GGE12640.1 hypothetical protein GCM10011529_18790 [Polymorphobacter glacialis]
MVAAHFAFILFALLGAGLLVRWPALIWLHLPALAWGIWIELSGRICPLTPIEMHYREAAGQGGYTGGFIDHYLTPIIYPQGLTRGTQALFAAILIGINALFYARFFWKRRQCR